MEILQGAFDLCLKIHEMYGTYTSNKETCAWLTRQVKVIEQTLGQQLARRAVPPDLDDALLSLMEVRYRAHWQRASNVKLNAIHCSSE